MAVSLAEAGAADRSEEACVTVAELSEQLLMSAKGIKASVDTLTAYRERMLTERFFSATPGPRSSARRVLFEG
jgi:hypothetical protein